MHTEIKLTGFEIQSGLDRQRNAELLILQLPEHHDGRNTWLLNYGIGPEAVEKRTKRGVAFVDEFRACETTSTR